jgi:hypothetical protein
MVVDASTKLDNCGGVTQECAWLATAKAVDPSGVHSGSGAQGWNDAHEAAVLFNLECNDSYVAAFLLNLGIGGRT